MKKRTTDYIISAVCVLLAAVCCVVVYAACAAKKNSAEKQGLNSDVIFECSLGDISGFSAKNGGGEYSLKKNGEEWQLEGAEDKKLEEKAVEETLLLLSSIKGNKIKADENKADFDKELKIFLSGGEEKFYLGEEKKGFYLKKTNGDIFEISQVVYSIAERDCDFYRDKTLSCIEMFNNSNFISFNYKPGAFCAFKETVNIRLKNEKEVQILNGNSEYMMDSPYLRSVTTGAFDSMVLAKISVIKAEHFITDNAEDLTQYGLEEGRRGEVTVETDKGSFRLYIGTGVSNFKDASTYVMLADTKTVFTVLSTNVAFAFTEPFDYTDPALCTYNLDYLQNAEINYNGAMFRFKNDKKKFYLNENPISDKAYSEFKDELEKVSISGETETAGGKELFDIKVTARYGETAEYKIYETDNKKYTVSENGLNYYLDEKSVEDFLSYLKKVHKSAK